MTDAGLKELLGVPPGLSLPHLNLLHYLLTESEGKHIAHCLELDLVAVGLRQEDAAAKLDRLVKAHIELALGTGQLVNLTTRAPQAYWDQFARGKRIDLGSKTIRIQIPESIQIVPMSGGELSILAHAA